MTCYRLTSKIKYKQNILNHIQPSKDICSILSLYPLMITHDRPNAHNSERTIVRTPL